MSIYIENTPIPVQTYPNGESRIDGDDVQTAIKASSSRLVTGSPVVRFHYDNDASLLHLALLKDYLDPRWDYELFIDYMPYSRMDRAEGNSVFTLKTVAKFINAMGWSSITVVEPHSDVTCALLDRAKPYYWTKEVVSHLTKFGGVPGTVPFDANRDFLVFPDAGAEKRYADITEMRTLTASKHRDFKTGRIDSLTFPPFDCLGTNALIVDDLSSYGGTFVRASKALKAQGVNEVRLLVAHAENAIFDGELLNHVEDVYCTDSMTHTKTDPRVHVTALSDHIER